MEKAVNREGEQSMEQEKQPLAEVLAAIPQNVLQVKHLEGGLELNNTPKALRTFGLLLLLMAVTGPVIVTVIAQLDEDFPMFMMYIFWAVGVAEALVGYYLLTMERRLWIYRDEITFIKTAMKMPKTEIFGAGDLVEAETSEAYKVNDVPFYQVKLRDKHGKGYRVCSGLENQDHADALAEAIMVIYRGA